MSEDTQEATNGSVESEQQDDIPKFHLYVRASLIDNETQGACPMSQQGFMLCYLLAQEKNVDFKVWTVSQVNPPADFKDKNRAKIYPFVEGVSGKDINGQSISGVMPDTTDKTDDFFDSVNFDCPQLKRPKNLKDHILGKIDGISTAFNGLLKDVKKEQVTKLLKRVNDHLATSGTTFLDGETLSYTDCFLLPRLQHINVAGKHFRKYEISEDYKHVWRYLRDAYETPAFSETLPTDADLLKFHYVRFSDSIKEDLRKEKIRDRFGVENPDMKTCSIPEKITLLLEATNGAGEDEEADDEMQQEQE